jgi:hypothetical protein
MVPAYSAWLGACVWGGAVVGWPVVVRQEGTRIWTRLEGRERLSSLDEICVGCDDDDKALLWDKREVGTKSSCNGTGWDRRGPRGVVHRRGRGSGRGRSGCNRRRSSNTLVCRGCWRLRLSLELLVLQAVSFQLVAIKHGDENVNTVGASTPLS